MRDKATGTLPPTEAATIERFHRTMLHIGLWMLPTVFLLEWVPEIVDGTPGRLPRWYIYMALWVWSWVLLHRARPNALWVMLPGIAYIAVNTSLEATWDRNVGAPDPATALAILVGLGVVVVALAYPRFWILLGAMTATVGTVATVTGIDQQLTRDELLIRIAAPMLVIGLAGWVIRRLRDDLARAARLSQESVEARDQLVAAVSHELRTPLTGILGLSEELLNRHDNLDATETSEFTRLIVEQSREMSYIIDDLLVAARVNAGSLTLRMEPIDAGEEITRVLEMVNVHLPSNRTITVEGPSATLLADRVRFRQIVRNLVNNATRYGGDETHISITLSDESAAISITDDGGNLDVEDAEAVFDPYFTAHEPHAVPGSVGLGLPVSRTLARLMDGDVTCTVESGTTRFDLSLPLANRMT